MAISGSRKKRVRVIHWNSDRADACARALRAAGYAVASGPADGREIRRLRDDPPAVFVIDLARQPSAGRDVALFLRAAKRSRLVPIVFVEGDSAKTARARALLPDAVFTAASRVRSAVARALARPAPAPAKPASVLAGYSGTPLPKKLGIRENSIVLLLGAPPRFEDVLNPLPAGAAVRRRAVRADITLWFPRSRADLMRRVRSMIPRADRGGLWILWPKKASGHRSDFSQNDVRRVGLAAGLVDYRICSVDDVWSGLRFSVAKQAGRG